MKITKKELFKFCDENNDAINELQSQSDSTDFLLAVLIQQLKDSGVIDEISPEPKPRLKQLDQSIFDGLDEKWRFAAFNTPSNSPILFSVKPHKSMYGKWYAVLDCDEYMTLDELEGVYEYTDDWQNSLIERDTAKEPIEVDLSSELTGSDLARAMLARGDKYVMCAYDNGYDNHPKAISVSEYGDLFYINGDCEYGVLCGNIYPINNQGEPLTASEAGL